MALKAKRDFPEIKFNKAIMVGDSLGDMLFGKRTGMYTVFIGDHSGIPSKYPHLVDYCYPSLEGFADTLKE
jgi:phosphoglycolate phosphatase-like HAD superfamily hydrolase